MTADATLVARAAVRQAVKNLMLVRALRDAADFDAAWYAAAVGAEFELLAVEAETDADRLAQVRSRTAKRKGRARFAADYRAADAEALRLRERVLRGVAAELRRLAEDEEAVAATIDEARAQALGEIASTAAAVPGRGQTSPLRGIARSRALQSLRDELSDYAGD